jgi:hypothetical protein
MIYDMINDIEKHTKDSLKFTLFCILFQISSCNQNHSAVLECNNLNMQIKEKTL